MIDLKADMFEIIGCESADSETISIPIITYWQDAWRRLKGNPIAMISLVVLFLMTVMVVVGPYIRGYDFKIINPADKNLGPSAQYWFGTDNLGRDLFSRVWYGSRASILVALVCTFIQIFVGSIYGGIMAYFGGWVDEIMMRIIEILSSIPYLLVTMLLMVILGNGIFSLLIAMSVTSWCGLARQVRGQIMQLREQEYVTAAEALGTAPSNIIKKHLIPNTMGILILSTATSIPEAGLSFLGMGLQPPDTSLGVLISMGQQSMEFHPYQLFFPALVLCLIVLAFNLLGDGLRDALDPRLRQ